MGRSAPAVPLKTKVPFEPVVLVVLVVEVVEALEVEE